MPKFSMAIIADGNTAPRFMLDALRAVHGCEEITVFACVNNFPTRRDLKHSAYYALNLLAVRNPMTKRLPLAQCGKRVIRTVEFEAERDGTWQKLPDNIVHELAAFDIVLKIGMGLLRVPSADRLSVPILSYHHGDPGRFRGRPAGFWETVESVPVMGQIVQRLSNELDAGEVLAFAETKVWPHSWRATLIEAYRHSPLLINAAIRNALAGTSLSRGGVGENYRLPTNVTVLALVMRMARHLARRLVYGAFLEKAWSVSLASGEPSILVAPAPRLPPASSWKTLKPGAQHSFYADPFFSALPKGILVEAMNGRTGLGEIALVTGAQAEVVSPAGRHFSYPCTVLHEGHQLVLPEAAEAGPPLLYRLEGRSLQPFRTVQLDEQDGLIDPTQYIHEGRYYLFANLLAKGDGSLFLWSADQPEGPFEAHPDNPIRISPRGSRMAGQLVAVEGKLYRLGQDFSGGYGDGIIVFEIEQLAPSNYHEHEIGALKFSDRRGPHTLNFDGGRALFDWYTDRWSLLAGYRRLRSRRRAASSSARPSDCAEGLSPETLGGAGGRSEDRACHKAHRILLAR